MDYEIIKNNNIDYNSDDSSENELTLFKQICLENNNLEQIIINEITPIEEVLKKMQEYIAFLSEEIKILKEDVKKLKEKDTE